MRGDLAARVHEVVGGVVACSGMCALAFMLHCVYKAVATWVSISIRSLSTHQGRYEKGEKFQFPKIQFFARKMWYHGTAHFAPQL